MTVEQSRRGPPAIAINRFESCSSDYESEQPGTILDPLTEIAREGARQVLAAALKAEAASFVASFTDEVLPDNRQRVVHHGTSPT